MIDHTANHPKFDRLRLPIHRDVISRGLLIPVRLFESGQRCIDLHAEAVQGQTESGDS
jgi:hypothetical protein